MSNWIGPGFFFASLTVVLAIACSGDDAPSITPLTSPTPSPDSGFGLITASPGRQLPPADHIGLSVIDGVTFMEQNLNGGAPTVVFCAGVDLEIGVIDCVDAGYGTIAVDPIPQVASGELECRVLLNPQGVFFAASCSGQLPTGPGAYIYGIQS